MKLKVYFTDIIKTFEQQLIIIIPILASSAKFFVTFVFTLLTRREYNWEISDLLELGMLITAIYFS